MRFMVEIDAGMEKANAIDASGGPGAMLAKLAENDLSRRRSMARRRSAVLILSSI